MMLCSTNFLFWKARRDKWTNWPLKSWMKSRVFTSVFQILNFRRTISTYFQDVLLYSYLFCLLTAFLLPVGERVRFLFTSCIKQKNECNDWVCFAQREKKIIRAHQPWNSLFIIYIINSTISTPDASSFNFPMTILFIFLFGYSLLSNLSLLFQKSLLASFVVISWVKPSVSVNNNLA